MKIVLPWIEPVEGLVNALMIGVAEVATSENVYSVQLVLFIRRVVNPENPVQLAKAG